MKTFVYESFANENTSATVATFENSAGVEYKSHKALTVWLSPQAKVTTQSDVKEYKQRGIMANSTKTNGMVSVVIRFLDEGKNMSHAYCLMVGDALVKPCFSAIERNMRHKAYLRPGTEEFESAVAEISALASSPKMDTITGEILEYVQTRLGQSYAGIDSVPTYLSHLVDLAKEQTMQRRKGEQTLKEIDPICEDEL